MLCHNSAILTICLWPDSISMAGLQASALLTTRRYTERDFAEVVVESKCKASEPFCAVIGRY